MKILLFLTLTVSAQGVLRRIAPYVKIMAPMVLTVGTIKPVLCQQNNAYLKPHSLNYQQKFKNLFAPPIEDTYRPVEFLIHVTSCSHIPLIEKTGELVPGSVSKIENYDYSKGMNYLGNSFVFMSLSNANSLKQTVSKLEEGECVMVFSKDLLEREHKNFHIGRGWLYGKRYEHYYDEEKEIPLYAESDNAYSLSKLIPELLIDDSSQEFMQNEVVFRKTISLSYLIKIIKK